MFFFNLLSSLYIFFSSENILLYSTTFVRAFHFYKNHDHNTASSSSSSLLLRIYIKSKIGRTNDSVECDRYPHPPLIILSSVLCDHRHDHGYENVVFHGNVDVSANGNVIGCVFDENTNIYKWTGV